MKNSLLVIPLALVAVLLSGCSVSGGTVKPLLEVGMSGGMCVDGSCASSYTVYEDGSTDAFSEPRVDTQILKLAIEDSKLDTLAKDPEAFCQSFVDGQDLNIRVYAWGDKTYKPCELKGAESDSLTIEAKKIMSEITIAEEELTHER